MEDNGSELAESVRKRIFEHFFTTKSVDKGGTRAVRVSYFIITEDHAGIMRVQTTLGEWTRFSIDLSMASQPK